MWKKYYYMQYMLLQKGKSITNASQNLKICSELSFAIKTTSDKQTDVWRQKYGGRYVTAF